MADRDLAFGMGGARTVDGGAAGVDQAFEAVQFGGGLEQMDGAADVDVESTEWLRLAIGRLKGGEVDDVAGPDLPHRGAHRFGVGDVALHQFDIVLQSGAIGVAAEADNLVGAELDQLIDGGGADAAGGSGDEDFRPVFRHGGF